MKSWKTTLGGILSGGGLAFAQFFPEWGRWGMFAAAIGTTLLGMAARDNNVTSEEAKAPGTVKLPSGTINVAFCVLGLSAVLVGCATPGAIHVSKSTVLGLDVSYDGQYPHVRLGLVRHLWQEIPTATNQVYTAAYATSVNADVGLTQQRANEEFSTGDAAKPFTPDSPARQGAIVQSLPLPITIPSK